MGVSTCLAIIDIIDARIKRMNRYETALFLGFVMVWSLTFGLHHFMVFRVNRQLPPERRIPHSGWGHWQRLRTEYIGLYPRSFLSDLMLRCAVVIVLLALAMVGLRIWEYARGS